MRVGVQSRNFGLNADAALSDAYSLGHESKKVFSASGFSVVGVNSVFFALRYGDQ